MLFPTLPGFLPPCGTPQPLPLMQSRLMLLHILLRSTTAHATSQKHCCRVCGRILCLPSPARPHYPPPTPHITSPTHPLTHQSMHTPASTIHTRQAPPHSTTARGTASPLNAHHRALGIHLQARTNKPKQPHTLTATSMPPAHRASHHPASHANARNLGTHTARPVPQLAHAPHPTPPPRAYGFIPHKQPPPFAPDIVKEAYTGATHAQTPRSPPCSRGSSIALACYSCLRRENNRQKPAPGPQQSYS